MFFIVYAGVEAFNSAVVGEVSKLLVMALFMFLHQVWEQWCTLSLSGCMLSFYLKVKNRKHFPETLFLLKKP